MSYVLDTNIAICLRDNDEPIMARVEALEGSVSLSIVTRLELEGGLYRDPARVSVRRGRLDTMFQILPVLPFDNAAADAYADIVAAAGYSRRKLLDRMIAAQALVAQATLVTMNAGDFNDIPGLSILAW